MITWPVPDDLSLSLSSLGVEIEIGVVPTSVTRQQLPLTVKLTDHTLVSYFTFWVRFPKIAKLLRLIQIMRLEAVVKMHLFLILVENMHTFIFNLTITPLCHYTLLLCH